MALKAGSRLSVFSLKKIGKDGSGTVWVRAGIAFVNRDDSITLSLDVLPLDGRLHCREFVAEKRDGAGMVPDSAAADLASLPVEGHS